MEKLTISLLRSEMTRDDALSRPESLTAFRVNALDSDQESLFVEARDPHRPRWAGYLDPHVSGDLVGLYAASASAVLLIDSDGRTFAVTFGQGRHLLQREAFEQDFGLKVVLNTVAPDQLKSVDAKTIDDTTVHTRRDLSRDSSFSAFGIDPSRDVLRAVTGTPRDETLAHRLSGSDALGIQTREAIPGLPALMGRLLRAYEADDYKQHFEFIDHLRPERSPTRLRRLQEELVRALASREITDVHLAAPETLDWLELDGFRFSIGSTPIEKDPSIGKYLDIRDADDLDISLLRRDKLFAIRSSDGSPMGSWSIYKCIVFQQEIDGYLYVLSAGEWFRVDMDYRQRLETEIDALPRLEGLPVPDAGTDEASYNLKLAAATGGLCLDRRLITDGGPDRMEICDVLTASRNFLHVKHRGSSSTLSHLFAQGVNSGERLMVDDTFRARARARVAEEDPTFESLMPIGQPAAPDYTVSFIVITRSARETPLTLPFFSVVSLSNATRRLRGFGYNVNVAAVREPRA